MECKTKADMSNSTCPTQIQHEYYCTPVKNIEITLQLHRDGSVVWVGMKWLEEWLREERRVVGAGINFVWVSLFAINCLIHYWVILFPMSLLGHANLFASNKQLGQRPQESIDSCSPPIITVLMSESSPPLQLISLYSSALKDLCSYLTVLK